MRRYRQNIRSDTLARRFGGSIPILFDPASILGCQLWLDAADTSSITLSGSNVTQWRDKSGNGLTVSAASSQPTYVTNALNGLGTLAFNGGQNLSAGSVTAGKLIGNTGSSATFCVFSVSDNTAGNCPISWDDSNYTYRYIITWDSSGIMIDLGDASAGIANRRITIPVSFANNTYCLVSFWQSGGVAVLNVNGGSYTITTSSGFTGNIPTSTSRTLNVGVLANASSYNMKGNTAEILIYNTHIPNNFKKVEAYLAQKWGLKSFLPANHPFKTTSPALSFDPYSIIGNQLWLDGADTTTITYGTGLSVASWRDKANSYAVANSSAAYRPIYSQGTIRFTGSTNPSYLDIPTLTIGGSSAFSIFFVIQNTGPASGNGSVPIFFWPLSGNGSGALSMTGWLDINVQGVNINISSTLLKNQYYVISYTFGVTSNFEQLYANGISIGTYQKSSGYSASLYRLGTIDSSHTTLLSDGNIGEMLVYNTGLTTSQRQQVEGYLANKWGLTSSLPANHPYKSIGPNPLTPASLSALFNNSSLTIPANAALTLGTNSHTIEFWMYQITRGQYDSAFAYGNMQPQTGPTNYYMNVGYAGFGIAIGSDTGDWGVQLSGPLASLNAWHHYAIVRNGNVFTLYRNGISQSSVTKSISIPAQGGVFRIGSDGNDGLSGGSGGYISNFRFVNGTAVYTSNFTPPTSPLTAIPNTQILLQGVVDRSANAFTVTSSGSVTLSTLSPFV